MRPKSLPQPVLVAALVAGALLPLAPAGPAGAPPAEAAKASAAKASQPSGDVRRVQRKLGIPADGVFGPQTKSAVRRFQRRHGLVADGIVGPMTRRALGMGSGPVLKRRRGSQGRARSDRTGRHSKRSTVRGGGVRSLQRVLGLPADGVFGPNTESAVKRFQRRHGLTVDGVVGPTTRRALGLGSGRLLKRRGRGGGGGGGGGRLHMIIRAANRIAEADYRYGGGHRTFNDTGYDCSGSVSYALHGAGLLASPLDSTGFMSYGSPGRGRHVTIYANAGHAFMVVDGRRFDTSAMGEAGSRWTWTKRSGSGFVARHPPGF
jgi:Putative peptidoglycan binding domain